jgi:hypothetical protein
MAAATVLTVLAQALCERARGVERDLLRAVDRLPMEGIAEGPAAEEHGA